MQTTAFNRDEDGNLTQVEMFTLDENRNVLTNYSDMNGDGTPYVISEYSYDENGYRLSQSSDYKGDGIITGTNNYSDTISYTFNENGQILTKVYDDDFSQSHSMHAYQYDERGNRLNSIFYNNGTARTIISQTFNEHNNILSITYDSGADGNLDEIRIYSYDANGNIVTESLDYNGDGIPDTINHYSYSKGAWPSLPYSHEFW